jgi:hypothetical protein
MRSFLVEAFLYFQLLSVCGAVLILFAYIAHQLRKMSIDTVTYQLLNLAGGFCLTVTACVTRQWGFIIMEGSWAVISAWGLWAVLRGRHATPLP